MRLKLVEKFGQLPAACQADPDVSSFALDQRHVAPAHPGQVMEHAAADAAAADHHDPRVRLHDRPLAT
jgi:hypothetical protein